MHPALLNQLYDVENTHTTRSPKKNISDINIKITCNSSTLMLIVEYSDDNVSRYRRVFDLVTIIKYMQQ